ncbi:MAG: hypothetical protein JWL85_372 [Candidatus Saccharibacteria bacterium]|nr:hypothetical protein [Candidatus Saccharibacteria bacterium]
MAQDDTRDDAAYSSDDEVTRDDLGDTALDDDADMSDEERLR